MSGRAVFVLVLVVLALAWAGYYAAPHTAQHFLPRGASTLTVHEIAAARAAMQQPLLARAGLARGDFRQAMDLLMFDGLSAGGDSTYTVALDADARAALARQIAIDAELALALATTEDDLAAVADLGERVAWTPLGAGAAPVAVHAGAAAAAAAAARAAAARDQRAAGELSGATAAAIILAGNTRHHSDSQNVHDSSVVDSLQNAAYRLVLEHGVPSPAACDAAAHWAANAAQSTFSHGVDASVVSQHAALTSLRSLHGNSSVRARPNHEQPLTLPQVLALVHARANDPANEATRAFIAENTAKALAESAGTCPTGRTSAILGALTLNDNLFTPPETQEQIRNDAFAAARDAGYETARRLANGSGPLAAAAANFIDPQTTPDPPADVAAELNATLAAAAVDAAQGVGKKFMLRPDALSKLETDVRAAYV